MRNTIRTRTLSVALATGLLGVVALTGCGPAGAEPDAATEVLEGGAAAPDTDGDDGAASEDGVTGTVVFDGTEVAPLDGLSCVTVPGDGQARIAGEVGAGEWLKLQEDSATYEQADVTWVTTSGDNRGALEVTEAGAQGSLLLYEEGTANDLGDQEFFEITVDLTC